MAYAARVATITESNVAIRLMPIELMIARGKYSYRSPVRTVL